MKGWNEKYLDEYCKSVGFLPILNKPYVAQAVPQPLLSLINYFIYSLCQSVVPKIAFTSKPLEGPDMREC